VGEREVEVAIGKAKKSLKIEIVGEK